MNRRGFLGLLGLAAAAPVVAKIAAPDGIALNNVPHGIRVINHSSKRIMLEPGMIAVYDVAHEDWAVRGARYREVLKRSLAQRWQEVYSGHYQHKEHV